MLQLRTLKRAQTIVSDALERPTSKSRIAYARRALAVSPLCADAYTIIATDAQTPEQAHDLYARGVHAAELAEVVPENWTGS